jgi:hypothetical protein
MSTSSTLRRVRAGLAATVAVLALASGCGVAGSVHSTAPASSGGHGIEQADEVMPAAPLSRSAWLQAVATSLTDGPDGMSAEAWLARRMQQAAPGERLAVVLGVDDVMVQTHFGAPDVLVEPTVQFVETAERLGYTVFYVTGRSGAAGLAGVRSTLAAAGLLGGGVCGRPPGLADRQAGKVLCRRQIVEAGYTLAMSVAASEVSFDGAYPAEVDVPLPDFAEPS